MEEYSMKNEISYKLYQTYLSDKKYPYITDNGYLHYVYETQDRNNNSHYYTIEMCNYFEIDYSAVSNGTSTVHGRVLVNANLVKFEMPASVFNTKNISAAMNYGFDVFPGGEHHICQYALEQISKAKKKNRINQVGWHKVEKKLLFQGYSDDNFEGRLSKNGDKDSYVEKLNELLKDAPGCQLSVAIGLSSSLLGLLNAVYSRELNSPIVHIFGASSTGKTTALTLSVSMWTSPLKNAGFLNNWVATDNAFISLLNQNNGVAVAFDDSSTVNKNISSLLYTACQGVDKSRLNSKAELRDRGTWNTVILSTGEGSLRAFTNQNEGLTARIIELFDISVTKNREHAERINAFCKNNYGILGSKFNSILKQKGKAGSIMKDFEETFAEISASLENPTNVQMRRLKLITVIILAAKYATELSVEMNISSITDILLKERSSVKESANYFEKVYDYICSYATSNYEKDFFCESIGKGKKNIVAFWSIPDFEKMLKEGGFTDADLVIDVLNKNDKYYHEKDRMYYRKKRYNILTKYCAVILNDDCQQAMNNLSMTKSRLIAPKDENKVAEIVKEENVNDDLDYKEND